ncbi:hypothetical protein ABIB62_000764 [Mucilaginibacter sp. UYP25]|uniref:DUF3857 domain-containing protein n=1 Tax=unclassified Mucilaginibacter TaxID=2617802 RepID=UPI00339AA308
MYKTITCLLLCLSASFANAQTTPTVNRTPAFGKVDVADLELKACDFESGATAEILFDKGDAYYDGNLDLAMERHKRIKIFNANAKNNGDIRIEYIGGNHLEFITGIQAQTINLVDGKPEITKLDKKLIFTEQIDKNRTAIVFSMPNVKAGSVIEYKYIWHTNSISNFPDWYFQDKLPTRYSQLSAAIPDIFYFKQKTNINQALAKYSNKSEGRSLGTGSDVITYSLETNVRALENVPSLPDEPYMTSNSDNLQSIVYQLTSVRPSGGYVKNYSDTWAKVGGILSDDEDFGLQIKRKLLNEDAIVSKAKSLETDEQKLQYVFNAVKTAMKWNGIDRWYTNDGTVKAWEKKTGNSAEINLILCHLLKQSGLKAYPMVVSTRDHGKVVPYFTFLYQFNRAVVYVPLNEDHKYVVDATGKYNIYNETPDNLLNSSALYIDREKNKYDIILLEKQDPVKQVTIINGTVKADGKIDGTAQINSFSYNRINTLTRYKDDGEKKYTDYLKENNNALSISSLKFENMDVDTLPLVQNINFNINLTGSDDNYIYFNPIVFNSLRSNPFLNEVRRTNIDFGYLNNYTVVATYKLPDHYKIDAMPKSVNMTMPDGSITFKRMLAEENGTLMVRYVISHKSTTYSKGNYADFYEFYKQMYEMLNEQIVLKKS